MRCAFINSLSNIVENIIVADASKDPAPEGFLLVNLPDDSSVSIGWSYDPVSNQFTAPAE